MSTATGGRIPVRGNFGKIWSGRADLANDSPMTAILTLAIPSMGLFVFNSLLHLVDTIFVSWLGELPMAAMSFTGPVNLCVFALLECVANGAIALMGRNMGRGDTESARHIARSALALLYVVCLISTPLILPSVSNVVFATIGAEGSDELLTLCWKYNMWIPILLPFMGFTYIGNTIFRAQGDTMTPFKAIALANTINIALDPLFIFVFGWGIGGAAIATWISRIASSLYLLRRMRSSSAIVVSPFLKPWDRLTTWWRAILWIGIPVALTSASIALGMGSVNKILSTFGHRAVASWMLGLRVEELAFNFANGINAALIPYIAFNYGRRDAGRMLAGFKSAVALALVLMCTMGAVIYTWPGLFLGLFRPVPEIEQMASRAIRASVPAYPFGILVSLSCGFFVGTGYSIFGTMTQLMRSIVFRVSAAWLFATYVGFTYIWWFQSFAAFCGSFVAVFLFVIVFRKIKRKLAGESASVPATPSGMAAQ
ncbi:MAG: MATE family efflux transporter [Synergistaceae bacterium]|nr:MATE family efflux transporter [Synergistaceae bacterium]